MPCQREQLRAPPTPGTAQRSVEVRRGADLLTARRDGYRPVGRGTRRDSVPCTPTDGPEGWNPRREEISTRAQRWKGDDVVRSGGPRRIRAEVRTTSAHASAQPQIRGR